MPLPPAETVRMSPAYKRPGQGGQRPGVQMSITMPRSVTALRAPDEPDESDTRTIEVLDVGRGRVSRLDDAPWTSELPSMKLDVTRPVEGADKAAVPPSPAALHPDVSSWGPVLRVLAVVTTAFVVGVMTGSDSLRNAEVGVADALVAGPVEVNGTAREVGGMTVVPVVVPLHNGGTTQVDVLSARPSGWPIIEAAVSHRAWALHPGHWRGIPISITVDCLASPPLTTSLDVHVSTTSGDETINLPMPSDTRNLRRAWQGLCESSSRRQELP